MSLKLVLYLLISRTTTEQKKLCGEDTPEKVILNRILGNLNVQKVRTHSTKRHNILATSLQLTIALAAGGTLESYKISSASTQIPQNGESCKSEQVVPGHNIFFMQFQAPLHTSILLPVSSWFHFLLCTCIFKIPLEKKNLIIVFIKENEMPFPAMLTFFLLLKVTWRSKSNTCSLRLSKVKKKIPGHVVML